MQEPSALTLAAAALLVLGLPLLRAGVRRKRRNRLLAEARQFVERVQQRRALSPVATGVSLGPGEHAFYCAPSVLRETRLARLDEAQELGAGTEDQPDAARIESHSVRLESNRRAEAGVLTVTNQRLIFQGQAAHRTVPLDAIAQIESGLRWIELGLQGQRRRLLFSAANPLVLAAIIRLCGQADNPLDLADTTLHVTLVD